MLIDGLSLHLNLLKKTPIPMYGYNVNHLKKFIIRSKKRLLKYTRSAKEKSGCSAVVVSAEWYEQNKNLCNKTVEKNLPKWKKCEIYRDLLDAQIVVVIALRSNKNVSGRTNKRIVDRAFKHKMPALCVYTRNAIKRDEASAEHIVPLSNGGNNSVWNLCVANTQLNNDRGNMNFWRYWRRLLSESI